MDHNDFIRAAARDQKALAKSLKGSVLGDLFSEGFLDGMMAEADKAVAELPCVCGADGDPALHCACGAL